MVFWPHPLGTLKVEKDWNIPARSVMIILEASSCRKPVGRTHRNYDFVFVLIDPTLLLEVFYRKFDRMFCCRLWEKGLTGIFWLMRMFLCQKDVVAIISVGRAGLLILLWNKCHQSTSLELYILYQYRQKKRVKLSSVCTFDFIFIKI